MIDSINEALNHYWLTIGDDQDSVKIRGNKHLNKVNDYLIERVSVKGVPEDTLNGAYTDKKKWDINFPEIKFAIEYKTLTAKNIASNRNNRIEEALGCSVNIKRKDSDYGLGYIAIFAFKNPNASALKHRDLFIQEFDKMVSDKFYDAFLPIQTFGIDNHFELSEKYSIKSFIRSINENVSQYDGLLYTEKRSLEKFFSK